MFGPEKPKASALLAHGDPGYRPPSPAADIFEFEPVPLDVFIQDKAFLGQEWMLSDIQWDLVRIIERVYLQETFDLLADHLGGYWAEPIPMKNLISAEWGKGSTAPYEKVYDARTGLWVRLDEMRDTLVASHRLQDGIVESRPACSGFQESVGQMFRVTLRSGLHIDVWEGHRFLSKPLPGQDPHWSRLWDLGVGSRVAVATRLPEPEETVEWEDWEVEWVGLMLGDGTVSATRADSKVALTIGYSAVRELSRVREIADYLGLDVGVRDDGRKLTVTPRQRTTKRFGNPMREVLFSLGLNGKTAYTKALPEEMFRLPQRQVALLLSRMIDTDGWVSVSNTAEIGYATVSRELAEGVQRLALRLGVLMSISEKRTSNQTEFQGRSFTVRVRDNASVATLARQLTLLDKEDARLAVLEHTVGRRQRSLHGDMRWDRIVSIVPLGAGPYWSTTEPANANYVAAGGVINRNSGKDSTVRVSAMRVAYLLMCLRSPQRYFQMPTDDSIHILNIAYNAPQAQRAFFEPLTRMVRRGWFKDRAEPKRDTIEYAKNVTAISGHSDAEAQEGLNIILGVADEIDAFKARGEMVGLGNRSREASTSAESILKMIESSAKSRFPRSYKRVAISYPRYLGSTIQKLTAEAREDNRLYGESSTFFATGPYATWEVNPLRSKEEFSEDYRKDPQEAAAKYECKPFRSTNSYFRNPQIFKQAADSEDQPIQVDYRIVETTSKTTGLTVRGWESIFTFSPSFAPIAGARYAMHGDLAISGDRAGIAMSHVERWEERESPIENASGEIEWVNTTVPVLRNDFTICFESDIAAMDPEKGPDVVLPREIQIRWARMLAFELIKRGFVIGSFTFDGFNSADTIQILNSHGIQSERVSTDLKPDLWKTPKDLASEGRLRMAWSLLLQTELESLTKLDNGKVDHPPSGSKDLADAFCCSLVGAIALGGQEDEGGEVVEPGGTTSFAVGEAVPGLTIYHQAGMGLPFGMKGMSFGG